MTVYSGAAINGGIPRGIIITVDYSGDAEGGRWVQTITKGGWSQFALDGGTPTNSLWQDSRSTGDHFYDSPASTYYSARPITGYSFIAETSRVLPNGSGGYAAQFSFQWGFNVSAAGNVTVIAPQLAPLWPAQQANIARAH